MVPFSRSHWPLVRFILYLFWLVIKNTWLQPTLPCKKWHFEDPAKDSAYSCPGLFLSLLEWVSRCAQLSYGCSYWPEVEQPINFAHCHPAPVACITQCYQWRIEDFLPSLLIDRGPLQSPSRHSAITPIWSVFDLLWDAYEVHSLILRNTYCNSCNELSTTRSLKSKTNSSFTTFWFFFRVA